MKTISKILSIVLALTLVLGLAMFVSAADTDTYEKVTTLSDGKYILVANASNSYYVAGGEMASDGKGLAYTKLSAAPGTTLTGVSYGTLTVTISNGTATLMLPDGKYLNPASSGNNLTSGTTATSWTVTESNGEYSFSAKQGSDTKYLCFNNGGYWRYYTDKSTNSAYDQTFAMYKLSDGSNEPAHTCEWNETADSCVAKTHLKHTLTYSCKDSTCDKTTTSDENHDYNSTGYCATCGYQFTTKGTLTITEANTKAAAAGDSYTSDFWLVSGKVKSVANATYGNLYIEDENGNELYVYGLYMPYGGVRYDEMETKPQVGDTITIATVLGTYTSSSATTNQAKNAWLMDLTPAECEHPSVSDYVCGDCGAPVPPEADTELSIEEIEVLAAAMNGGVTPDKYYVVGVITEITNETYGNMVIEDEAGNTLVIYGSYDATGENRYDAMTAPHAVGDTVKIYGAVTQYNNVAEVVNGWVEIVERGENPNTGDSTSLIPAVIVAALAVTGTALVIKKKEF